MGVLRHPSTNMEIDIWKGEWGLPSIDVQCLQVMTLAKFSGAPLKINTTNNPLRTPTGSLPVFRHDDECLTKVGDISSHLRRTNHNSDYELSPKQCAEVLAYSQLICEKLSPALKFVWWMDAKHLLGSLYNDDEDLSVIETAVYKEAEECITLLAVKLGDKDFFFGQTPFR